MPTLILSRRIRWGQKQDFVPLGATLRYKVPPSPCRPILAIALTLAAVSFPMESFFSPRFSHLLLEIL